MLYWEFLKESLREIRDSSQALESHLVPQTGLIPSYVSLNLFSEVNIIIPTLQGHFEDYILK